MRAGSGGRSRPAPDEAAGAGGNRRVERPAARRRGHAISVSIRVFSEPRLGRATSWSTAASTEGQDRSAERARRVGCNERDERDIASDHSVRTAPADMERIERAHTKSLNINILLLLSLTILHVNIGVRQSPLPREPVALPTLAAGSAARLSCMGSRTARGGARARSARRDPKTPIPSGPRSSRRCALPSASPHRRPNSRSMSASCSST